MSASPPSYSEKQRWSIALHVAVSTLAVLALAVMANYLAASRFTRWQWRGDNPNQLTPQTLNLLGALTNEVRATVLYDRGVSMDFFSAATALLTEYRLHCPRLRVEALDFVRNPTSVALAKARWKTSLPDETLLNTVVFECQGRAKAVSERDLYSLDLEGVLTGKSKEVKRSAFQGELKFSEAINNVTDVKQTKAYFLLGHSRARLDDDGPLGFSDFGALVRVQNIRLENLEMNVNSGEIPADCGLLLVAAPTVRFEPDELDRLDRYLGRGGRMLVLLTYAQALEQTATGLEGLLAKWGVRTANEVVWPLESGGRRLTEPPMALELRDFPAQSHPIVRPLLRARAPLRFILPRTVRQLSSGRQDADSPKVDALVQTDTNVLVISRFTTNGPVPSLISDPRGPVPVAVAVEKGSVQGLGADRASTRLVVVGDSLCLGNSLLESAGNRDFAIQVVNWLVDNPRLMDIAPRPIKEYRVVMSPGQLSTVRWLLMLVFPGAVLVLGVLVWFRRRT